MTFGLGDTRTIHADVTRDGDRLVAVLPSGTEFAFHHEQQLIEWANRHGIELLWGWQT